MTEFLSAAATSPGDVSEDTTVGVLLRQAARFGERPLLYHRLEEGGWRAVSWSETATAVLRIAARLVASGVGPGDRVLLLAENCWQWPCCDLGIQAAGAVTVPIYPSSRAAVVERIAADSGAVVAMVAGDGQEAKLRGCAAVRRVVRLDRDVEEWMAGTEDASEAAEVARRLRHLEGGSLASIVYTSGTSGEPRGVLLDHRSFTEMARSALSVYDLGPTDSELSYLPYAHVLERTSGIFTAIAAGTELWVSRGMNHLMEDIEEVRPTVMLGVPRVFEKVYKGVDARLRSEPAPRRALAALALALGRRRVRNRSLPLEALLAEPADRLVLEPLRRRLTGGRLRFFVSGGAPLLGEVEEFFWAIGVPILQGWGLTETNSACCGNRLDAHRPGSVGLPLPGVEIRADEVDGELLVRSPGNMLGYHGNPAATAEALQDGWLRTGDIGRIDDDGYVWITDRKKDLIKTSGGKYVAPQPMEVRLAGDRLIQSAIVLGDQRPFVTALIVPDWEILLEETKLEGPADMLLEHPTVNSLIQACVDQLNSDLTSFETIKRYRLLPRDFLESEGELTPTYKIKRRIVYQRYGSLIDSMYEGT